MRKNSNLIRSPKNMLCHMHISWLSFYAVLKVFGSRISVHLSSKLARLLLDWRQIATLSFPYNLIARCLTAKIIQEGLKFRNNFENHFLYNNPNYLIIMELIPNFYNLFNDFIIWLFVEHTGIYHIKRESPVFEKKDEIEMRHLIESFNTFNWIENERLD